MSGRIFPLADNQALAVDPERSVWLSASAGTGKTQVLSARVLRLLLRPEVEPSQILCLTFTKAGAAEMATRVNEVLASWVRMKDARLAQDLAAIGAPIDPATVERARTLFASVLDCPGGGLRIDTIHAFSQWLLAAFPEEAGLLPGTRAMEDRDREVLAHSVLADLLVRLEEQGDEGLLDALAMLTVRLGADGASGWLMRCAEARELWTGSGGWQPPVIERVRMLLGLAANAGPESIAALCGDDAFDCASLRRLHAANAAWGTATAAKSTAAIDAWLAGDPAARADAIDELRTALFTQADDPRALKSLEKHDPDYAEYAARVLERIAAVVEQRVLLELADLLAPALEIGRAFALAWDAAKQREGLIDFDDQIRRAARLLKDSSLSDWIRYKLDRRFDHILIDEAQDTNEAQWDIIDALTDDFFAGAGQREGRLRTIFVVGDYKQAIFGFQGTSPENFARARGRYEQVMADAVRGAATLREPGRLRELLGEGLHKLGLGRSYRTAQPVLDFVDAAIARIGPERFGLSDRIEPHVGDASRAGMVTLWQPVGLGEADEDADPAGPEEWVNEPERILADRIAAQVKRWLDEGYPLEKGERRNAGPGDVMVLVRKRRELAGLIVARLHAAGVPVAGVDRLRLGAPLAVKDLMAALRFAAQPLDDLSLAALLVSPIFGWSQDELLEHGHRDKGVPLWSHLRDSEAPGVLETVERLRDLLRIADYEPPQALLHWMLIGPWRARRALLGRLGREAADPIDELLNAAHAYAAAHTPSLQGFIQWFDAGEGELKREAEGAGDLVRVMTVHGSKGLQAPIVILADALGDPDRSRASGLELVESLPGGETGRRVPMLPVGKELKAGPLRAAEEAARAAEREEHWRLLYVAMTRAEEALFIAGALLPGDRGKMAGDSWYAQLEPLFEGPELDDPVFGTRRELGRAPAPLPVEAPQTARAEPSLPQWATRAVGPEPRPPRPLAPSSAGEERGSDPPLPPEQAQVAARRGVLIHALLERLPDIPQEQRAEAAGHWLARNAADLPEEARAEMAERALAVLDTPEFARVFAPDALAEIPLAAVVDGLVVAGTADRLLVTQDEVTVVDFKTARRPPASLETIPESTLRQMAAYVAALEAIYPGRAVRAAVLYTQTPQIFALPPEWMEERKSALQDAQESYPLSPVE